MGRNGQRRDARGRDPGADDLSPAEFSATVAAITNAFGDSTRRRIYLFAHETEGGVTAAKVAEHFGLHPNVARHHLDKLAAGGYLEVLVAKPSGSGAGRPAKHYRRSAEPVSIDHAVRIDDLLLSLLGRALALLTPAQAQQMAEEVGVEYGRAMAASMAGDHGQRSFRAALHAVADALTAHGFAAQTEKRGNELRIVNNHCPFGDTAIEHPVICAVDRGMVKGMLAALYAGEVEPELAASRPTGDQVCVTSF